MESVEITRDGKIVALLVAAGYKLIGEVEALRAGLPAEAKTIDWGAADRIAEQQDRWLGDFAWGEFIDTVARKVRTGELSIAAGRATATGVRRFFSAWSWAAVEAAAVIEATRLIENDFARSLKLPDAIHLATTRRIGADLLTSNTQLARAAHSLQIHCIFLAKETS